MRPDTRVPFFTADLHSMTIRAGLLGGCGGVSVGCELTLVERGVLGMVVKLLFLAICKA